MRRDALSFARKKALRETSWSAIIILVISVGQTAWISIPSVGLSLESGVQSYANAAATYIIVNNNGNPATLNQTIPQSVIDQIRALPGIQEVHPIVTTYTIFFDPPTNETTVIGNKTVRIHYATLGILSAVVGGDTGYPQQLLGISVGRAPIDNEAGFVFNTNVGYDYYKVNDTARVQVANVNFTATETGISKDIPLLGTVGILWDSTFMKNELGPSLYESTYGKGTNFIIAKAATIRDVAGAIPELGKLFQSYSAYHISYDQATIDNLLSLQNGVAPLYELLGILSLVIMVAAILTISYIAVSRRAWESGLLISQGWSWSDLRTHFFCYFSLLSGIALALSIMLSYVVSRYSGATFEIYGGYISIAVSPQSGYLEIAGVMAVVLAVFAAQFTVWRIRRIGLDSILREF